MFKFDKEQEVFDFAGVKMGGQPEAGNHRNHQPACQNVCRLFAAVLRGRG